MKKDKNWVKNLFFNKKKIKKMGSKKFKLQKDKKDKISIKNLIFNKNMITSMLLIGLLSFTLVKTANITATFDISDLAQTSIETSIDDEHSNDGETANSSVTFKIKDIFETNAKEAAEKKAKEEAAALEKQRLLEEQQRLQQEQEIVSTNVEDYTSYPTESRVGWTNKIDVNGTVLNWNYSYNAASAPATGCGIWDGNGSTTDDQGAWFIGHNPGDFACAYNLNYGDPVTVYDEFGNSRTYNVVDIFEISRDTMIVKDYDENGNVVQQVVVTPDYQNITPRIYPGGETVALQSCTPNNTYKLVIGR